MMVETQRPDWWPPWEPNKYPPFTFHAEVWNAGVVAAVKAVLGRIRELGDGHLGVFVDEDCILSSEEWQQLRKEAGLD